MIILIKTTITASTSSMWINPPRVVEVTIPSNHKTSKIMAIVHNMTEHPFLNLNYFNAYFFLDAIVLYIVKNTSLKIGK